MRATDGVVSSRRRRVTLAVVAIAVLGLLARIAFLGDRIAHWDEARVGYWILNYAETGSFVYRPMIHGPFLHQVNAPLFSLLGPNDFTMRLVVAILGAALPLVALLFRDRLRSTETIALALFLAADPVLLYYSRFMRSDLPLAVFSLFAVGFFVQAIDTRRERWFHAGVISLALAFTTKENVLITLVTWLGALALLVDHRLFLDRGWQTALRRRTTWIRHGVRSWTPHLLAGMIEFLAIVVYFYAPRRTDGPGFDDLLADPTTLPAVVGEATLGSWNAFYSLWIEGGHQDHPYLPYLADYLETLSTGSGALVVLAVVGFLVDRYTGDRPRDLVAFCFYWGVVSVLGYPIATDIMAPWATIHAIVPLAVPAAAGVGVLFAWGRAALADDNRAAVAAVAIALLLVVAQIGVVAADDVYLDSQSDGNELVQYAQPADDFHPAIDDMAAVSATNEGTDVLVYGEFFVAEQSGAREPGCTKWFNLLPIPWYTESTDATVSCARNVSAFERRTAGNPPPVVIGLTTDRAFLADRLDGYDARSYVMRTQDTGKTNTTFFVDTSRLPANATAGTEGNP
ncbi:flippase activity-associated protein Agl23 [Halococcus saccharolyticus]|uniref:Membrane-bound mannosyltransferase n=1 Tax=Halococcus saccharolyticus DSM 5350 TaxID=1227455 RepID=M0MKI5_9EURY|nr:flippase activity-associated protein Agl23 [Halococcus saccharolyticus]EMA45888.1 membrane-bound mannosyltransferase [Halococcus saccharolyticus DSM 5350]